jgi:hypothetical protein
MRRSCGVFRAVFSLFPFPSPGFLAEFACSVCLGCVYGVTAMPSAIWHPAVRQRLLVPTMSPPTHQCFVKPRQLLACVLERAYAGMRSCSPVPDDGKERMKARWPTVVQVNAVKRSGCYQTVSLICNVIKCVFVFVNSAKH